MVRFLNFVLSFLFSLKHLGLSYLLTTSHFVICTNYLPLKLDVTVKEGCARELRRGQVQCYIHVIECRTGQP